MVSGSVRGLISRARLIPAAAAIIIGAIVSSSAATSPAGSGGTAAGPSDLKARVESQRFYYAGDPILVRVTLSNEGKSVYDNSKGFNLLGSLVVNQTGTGSLKHKGAPAADPRVQPATLIPGGYFGVVGDARDAVEGLDKAGRYTVLFQSGGIESEPVPLLVIPRYDATKTRRP
jgi:hypothetical protein